MFPGSRMWKHESGNSKRSVEQMIKLGVTQINTKEWRKSTLAPLNAQNVGRRSSGNTDLSDFVSIWLPVPLRISMKKMSSF